MPRLADRVMGLQESAIRKLDAVAVARTGVRFYRLNIGQPDIDTPAPLRAAIAGFTAPVLAYGPSSGTAAARAAAARYFGQWSPGLEPRHVALTTGGSEALLFAFSAVADPGDEILAPEPYYTNYNGFASVVGARIRPVPTTIADGFALPSDDVLDAHVTPRTRALVFANPGNPTGAVYPRAELERLGRWAERHDLFLIADEVYRRIWFEQEPTSLLELPALAERAIVADSLSKAWAACGVRMGFFVSRNAALMERVERLGQARLGPQPLAQAVAEAALALPESYYAEQRALWKSRVDALYAAVSAIPGVQAHKPAGAFYLMLRVPGLDAEAFARFLAAEFEDGGESVMVAPGPGFYADPSRGRDELRLAAVLSEPSLRRAAALLGLAIAAFRARAAG